MPSTMVPPSALENADMSGASSAGRIFVDFLSKYLFSYSFLIYGKDKGYSESTVMNLKTVYKQIETSQVFHLD